MTENGISLSARTIQLAYAAANGKKFYTEREKARIAVLNFTCQNISTHIAVSSGCTKLASPGQRMPFEVRLVERRGEDTWGKCAKMFGTREVPFLPREFLPRVNNSSCRLSTLNEQYFPMDVDKKNRHKAK